VRNEKAPAELSLMASPSSSRQRILRGSPASGLRHQAATDDLAAWRALTLQRAKKVNHEMPLERFSRAMFGEKIGPRPAREG
jgi:hypothetical protein